MLQHRNGFRLDRLGGLETGSADELQRVRECLGDWGVSTTEQVRETLGWLFSAGHRAEVVALAGRQDQFLMAQGHDAQFRAESFQAEWLGKYRRILADKTLVAWDAGRAVALANWAFALRLIGDGEAWHYIMAAAKALQQTYGSWYELGEHYCLGYEFWAGKDGSGLIPKVQELCVDPGSPWMTLPWNLSLDIQGFTPAVTFALPRLPAPPRPISSDREWEFLASGRLQVPLLRWESRWMTAEQDALVARFEAFLTKLTERLDQLIVEADTGTNALASQRPDELFPVRAALGALDVQIQKLTDKLDTVWSEQIEPMFKALDERLALGGAFWDAGLDRRDDVRFAIESRWSLFKAKKEGDVLRALWPRAAAAMAKTHPCSNCGAPMQLRVPYRAEAIPCPHCGAVNQLMPAPLVSTYFLNAEQVFPEEASQPQRWEIERFRAQAGRATRNGEAEPVESLRRWRDLERAYHQRRAEVRASILGQPIDQAGVESQMRHFEQETLGRIQAWVRGGDGSDRYVPRQ